MFEPQGKPFSAALDLVLYRKNRKTRLEQSYSRIVTKLIQFTYKREIWETRKFG